MESRVSSRQQRTEFQLTWSYSISLGFVFCYFCKIEVHKFSRNQRFLGTGLYAESQHSLKQQQEITALICCVCRFPPTISTRSTTADFKLSGMLQLPYKFPAACLNLQVSSSTP